MRVLSSYFLTGQFLQPPVKCKERLSFCVRLPSGTQGMRRSNAAGRKSHHTGAARWKICNVGIK